MEANGTNKIKKAFLIMMNYSFFTKTRPIRLRRKVFIFSLFFLLACTSHRDPTSNFSSFLSSQEKENLKEFLESLLFKNYGVYVLFGSKPLSEFSVHNMDSFQADEALKKFLAELPSEEREKIEALRTRAQSKKTQEELDQEVQRENTNYKGWLAFQKLQERFKLKDFLFRVLPSANPDAYDIFFINIQQTALVLAENYEVFKQASGMEFNPLYVVFEAQDPHSLFWKNVMAPENHLAKGLLFGFGRQNSLFASWAFPLLSQQHTSPNQELRKKIETFIENTLFKTSTDLVPKRSFSIPVFGAIPGDETVEKYRKERSFIEKKYRNQDLIEVTLKQIFHPPGTQKP